MLKGRERRMWANEKETPGPVSLLLTFWLSLGSSPDKKKKKERKKGREKKGRNIGWGDLK